MAPRAGTAAVVLIAVLFCLLVAPAPARRPAVELREAQVDPDDVDRKLASLEPLLPKPLEGADAADDAAVPEDEKVARADARDELVVPCGGDAAIVSSSDEPLSLGGQARPRPAPKVEEEDTQERPYDSDTSDSECDTDSDSDSDDDDESGIVGWFWRLADRLF